MNDSQKHLLALSARIVGAHLAHNEVATDNVPAVIRNVYSTLADLGAASGYHAHGSHSHMHAESGESAPHGGMSGHHGHAHARNAYQHPLYGQTVYGDHLVCMECGLRMKMLKRHLQTVHNLTPKDYRAKWSLPSDYPMVASDYAKLRSSLAIESGLGLKPDDRKARSRRA